VSYMRDGASLRFCDFLHHLPVDWPVRVRDHVPWIGPRELQRAGAARQRFDHPCFRRLLLSATANYVVCPLVCVNTN
jgi:hypothetical protein